MHTFGKYALDAVIGRGGMADVYRARVISGPRAGHVVALKRLRPNFAHDPAVVDVFLGEADLGRYLQHPNVIQVLSGGLVADVPYMTMEYVDGVDLSRVLNCYDHARKLLSVDVVCYIVQVVATALDFVHRAVGPLGQHLGIVHCDINPSNIMVTRDGDIKLGDFGVAHTHLMGNAFEGAVAGKSHFLAPEIIAGEEATPAADIFALGVTLYELLTMQRPFEGATPRDVAQSIMRGSCVAPSALRPALSPALNAIVMRALAIPRQARRFRKTCVRFAAASDLAHALGSAWNPPLLGTSSEMTARLRQLVRFPGLLPSRPPATRAEQPMP